MSKGVRVARQWFWLSCPACGWRGQADKRLRKCPRCEGKSLKREGKLSVAGELFVKASGE